MKRMLSLLTVIALMAGTLFTSAQTPQVNNADFESWDSQGTSDEEPTQWNSFMSASGFYATFAAQQVKRSTVTRPGSAGTYSALIWARDATLALANGNLTTGRINMGSSSATSSSNYNTTLTSDANYNEAINAVPDSLVVWVRAKFANTSYQPRINAIIHDSYDLRDPVVSGTESHIVASATLNWTPVNSVWVRKSIPFVAGAGSNPAYALISITTCKDPGSGSANDSLYIDDLMFIYTPELTTGTINPSVYTVTATDGAAISIPFTLTGTMYADNIVTAQLSDATGSFAAPVTLGTLNTTTSGTISGNIPANTPSGTGYRVRVVSTNYPITAADNGSDIQVDLTVGISENPSANTRLVWNNEDLSIDLSQAAFMKPSFILTDLSGRILMNTPLVAKVINHLNVNLPAGIYGYSIQDLTGKISGKIFHK